MSASAERKLDASPAADTHATRKEAETEESPPQKKPTHRRGQRAPQRDSVGPTEAVEEKAEKCSFSGAVVNLSPAQLSQAAISKLQCPECGAIWTARVRGETVSFPPHPPPTKRRAQAIPRWIRQGASWTLYSKGV